MTENELFQDDIYLSAIAEGLDKYSLIIINIYDILLLRFAHNQEDIFEEIGRRLNSGFAPETFRNFRVVAEARARQKAKAEGRNAITLDEVYAQLSRVDIDVKRAMELEFAAQRELTYLNPSVSSFIKHCHALGVPVALVGDTCFSKPQMKELLENAGYDLYYTEHFLVSSECCFSTADGGLFGELLSLNPNISRESVLYIGSNPAVDIISAAKAGIPVFWYPVVSETQRGIFAMERDCYSNELGGLAALRSLATSSVPEKYRNGDDKLWFQTGCGTLGVVYTLFAEWVVMQAVVYGISKITCFMREGGLLAEFIRREAENRELELDISTLFISRRASVLPGVAEVGKETILQMASQPRLTLEDLFINLYLDIEKTPFSHISKKTINDCQHCGELSAIHEYLIDDEVVSEINKNAREQRKLLLEYVQGITHGERTITVDAGMHGSIQRNLHNAFMLENVNQEFKHLIMVGAMQNDELVMDGIDISAFIRYPGESKLVRPPLEYKAFIYELCCGSDIGVTLRYSREQRWVIPVLEKSNISNDIIRSKHIFQDGMLAFQAFWFMLRNKNISNHFLEKKANLYAVLRRFIEMPLNNEARLVGSLISDDGHGMSDKLPIAPRIENVSFSDSRNIEQFIREGILKKKGTLWTEGMVENTYPDYFVSDYRDTHMTPELLRLRRLLQNDKTENKCVAIYGASATALDIARDAWKYEMRVSYIVDKNINLHGLELYGIPVISPEASVGKVDIYIIAPLIYGYEIKRQIEALHEGLPQPEVFLRNEI